MIAEIRERDKSFDAEENYAQYLKHHGDSARKLRKAASEAKVMQVYIKTLRYQNVVEEYLPLTEDETQAVREILVNVQATPTYDFKSWLAEEYDSHFIQAAQPPYILLLEFLSSGNSYVLPLDGGIASEIGDWARANEYRLMRPRPAYMLPAASLARWNALPFLKKAKEQVKELYEKH
jgi:hypothetical protein